MDSETTTTEEKDSQIPESSVARYAGKRGGYRHNAGRKKGSLDKTTKDKIEVLKAMRERILNSADKLLNSQMNLAEGCSYLYVQRTNKKGIKEKPELITDQATIESYLAGELDGLDDEYYYITTERPDNRALDSLWDRTFGKVPNKLEGGGEEGEFVFRIIGNNYKI